MKWLLFLFIPLGILYLFLLERRENRERTERKEKFNHLKEELAGRPDELRHVEILEIENELDDKIADKLHKILSDETRNDLYAGAFKDYKPDANELADCIANHGYRPDLYDDKVSDVVSKLSQDPELTFLRNHGVRKEAELRQLRETEGN